MEPVNQKLSRMAAALIPRELANWSLTAVALGALEGGLLGVIAKIQFAGAAVQAGKTDCFQPQSKA